MPKPDQKVTISAALQRPQRHKASPKPIAQNLESVLQPVPETLELAKAETQELTLPVLEELTAFDQIESESQVQIPDQVAIKTKIKIKDKIESLTESPAKSAIAKPKLKPKPKAEITDQLVPEVEIQIDFEVKVNLSDNRSSDLSSDLLTDSTPFLPDTSNPLTNIEDSPVNLANSEATNAPTNTQFFGELIQTSNLKVDQHEQLVDLDRINEPNEQIDLTPKTDLNSEPDATAIAQNHQDHKQDQKEDLPIFWCQAVGLITGKYVPSAEAFYKGELITTNGSTYKAYVLSKAIKALEKKIDLSLAHQFVVYPKTSKIHGLRLEILATDVASKIEEFEDGQFNIRGFITKKLEKQLENSFLVEIQRRPEYLQPSQNDRFTLNVKGDIPQDLVQQFVYLKCQLIGDELNVIDYEHLACPVVIKRLSTVVKPILKPKAPKPELD